MKYINIKRYKFSTILKNINTAIVKNFNRLGGNFLKISKLVNHKQYDFKKIAEYFDPRNYESIISSIEKVVYSNEYSKVLIKKGRERVSKFSWKNCASETNQIYQNLI